jgi:thiamine biosynthesis protein ThiS
MLEFPERDVLKFQYNEDESGVSTMVPVTVNGEQRMMPAGCTILALLESLNLDPARVAVEVNGRIVRQPDWGRAELSSGSQVEVVQFVGGG